MWRQTNLNYCTMRCSEGLPIRPEYCQHCRDWQAANPAPPPAITAPVLPDKRVVELRQDFAADLEIELKELIQDHNYFKIPKVLRLKLLKYWRTQLRDFDGQYHRWYNLAEILDPMRGSDIDPQEAFEVFEVLLKQFPKPGSRDFLAPNPNLAALFPNSKEPWITTFLRTMCKRLDAEEGEFVEGSVMMAERLKHLKNPEKFEGWDGDFDIDWPVGRILGHHHGDDGIRYHVRFLGTDASEDVWLLPIEFWRPVVFRVYNRENDVNFDEAWLQLGFRGSSSIGDENSGADLSDETGDDEEEEDKKDVIEDDQGDDHEDREDADEHESEAETETEDEDEDEDEYEGGDSSDFSYESPNDEDGDSSMTDSD